MNRKLKMGMIGGGQGALIGTVHRMSAQLDGLCELVCGAFSSTPERSKASGAALNLPDERVYSSFEEMIECERSLSADERMDFVSIVTPNHLHFAPAKNALVNGFPVICDKPLCYNLTEARELRETVRDTGLLFGLTHNYTGYPMVKEARHLVRTNVLGKIRKVIIEYSQGWLASKLEDEGNKQAEWRTDPKRSGKANCMGDIGTHAENLAEYVTGLTITDICADLTSFVPGRKLDDDGNVLLRFEGGARGILHASQICAGEENGLRLRVFGEKGGIDWIQTEPNTLVVKWSDRPTQLIRTGGPGISALSRSATRLPMGHPEGFIEAFANIYRNYLSALISILDGNEPEPWQLDFPTIDDGVRGMEFIETVVASSMSTQKWTPFPSS